jgi:hypothetical protein
VAKLSLWFATQNPLESTGFNEEAAHAATRSLIAPPKSTFNCSPDLPSKPGFESCWARQIFRVVRKTSLFPLFVRFAHNPSEALKVRGANRGSRRWQHPADMFTAHVFVSFNRKLCRRGGRESGGGRGRLDTISVVGRRVRTRRCA